MNRGRLTGDAGLAAVEFGILLSLLLVIAAVCYPLGQAFYDKMLLDRAAGDTLRFATATPNTPAYGSSGRRPSASDVEAEAQRAFVDAGGSAAGFSADVTTAVLPGGTVTVTLHKDVDLGPLGSVLSTLHVIGSRTITVSVNTSGREE